MSLREDLQAAITEAYALLSAADEVWCHPDGPDLDVLAELYDDLASQGDGILAFAGSLTDGISSVLDARTAAEDAQAEVTAAIADLRV